jgi:hypothetical protein
MRDISVNYKCHLNLATKNVNYFTLGLMHLLDPSEYQSIAAEVIEEVAHELP